MTNRFRGGLTTLLLTCLIARAAVAADAPGGGDDPTMPKVPQGWKVELIAKAPQLHYPSVVCATPDGRILIAEHPMDQTGPANKPIDRILCIHPDGRITVYAENLYAVFGLAYLDGRVYVHQCPIFSVFNDGGDRATDRKDLIDTTWPQIEKNGGLNDHIPAQIRLGMDGYFYMSVGDKGIYNCVSNVDGSKAENRGGCILRLRPDGTELEIYANGTRNHLDVALNAEGELFTYDNTDDGRGWWTRYTHMVDGGFYGYPWDYHPPGATPEMVQKQIESGTPGRPYTLWRMAEYGGGSPCGAISYNEDALPPEYHGNNFHCEWGKGALERFVVERDGATYKVVKREPVMTPGGDLRPIGIDVTPDGLGFLVADWNLGGWAQPKDQGRLFRMTWTGKNHAAPKPEWFVPAAMGKPFKATTQELVAALRHPAESVRLVAQRRIAEREAAEAVPMLVALLDDTDAPPHARWFAIWTLDRFEKGAAGRDAILKAAGGDNDVSVRAQAIRQLGTRRAKKATQVCAEALGHADAQIRFRAATALGRIGDPAAVPALISKLDEKDFFTQYAVFTALNRIGRANPAAWAAVVKALGSENPTVRARAAFAMRETYDDALVAALTAYIADASNPSPGRSAAMLAAAPLHKSPKPWDGGWWGTQPVQAPPPAKEVEWAGTKAVAAAVQAGLADKDATVRLAAVEAVQLAPDPATGPVLAQLFQSDKDPTVRKSILRALAASKSDAAGAFIVDILKDPKANAEMLPDAVRVAEQMATKDTSAALTNLTGQDLAPEVLTLTIEAMGRLKDPAAVPALVKRTTHDDPKVALASVGALAAIPGDASAAALVGALKDARPEVRRAAATGLGTLNSPAATEPLIEAAKDPEVQNEAIGALAARPDLRALDAYLTGLASPDGTLRDRCRTAVAGISREALPIIEKRLDENPLPTQVIAELQTVYTSFQPVMQWKIVGPFDKTAAPPFPVENPPAQGDFKGKDQQPTKWFSVTAGDKGMIDLGQVFTPLQGASAYAVTDLNADAEREVEFVAGSDDTMTVWLNGQQLHDEQGDSGWNPDESRFKGRLKAGRNPLVLRVGNQAGGWQFSLALSGQRTGKLFEYDTTKLSPDAFAAFAMANKGDVANGQKVFANVSGAACIKCHNVDGQGGEVGPALTGVGAKYDRAKLIESVVYPSKQIFDGYQQTILRTKKGQILSGSVRAETDTELTLIDAENKKHVIRKADVDRRKVSEQSVMPEGLHTALKPEEFADLISYLESLKEAPASQK